MKNDITICFKNIKENMQTVNDIEKALYHKMDFETFKDTYIERGNKLREIFKSNQKDLDTILNLLDFELTKDIADKLYDGYRSLLQGEIKDSTLVLTIVDKLIPFYESINDYTKLIHLYSDKAVEISTFFITNSESIETFKECTYKILSLKKYYEELGLEERKIFYYAYYNLMSYLPSNDEKCYDDILLLYKEAKEFYNSASVLKMQDQDLAREEFSLLNRILLHSFMYFLDDGLSSQIEYIDIIDEIKNTFEDERDRDLANAIFTYLNDQMNDLELIYYLKNYYLYYYEELLNITYKEDRDFVYLHNQNVIDAACLLLDFVKHSYVRDIEKEDVGMFILTHSAKLVKRVPKDIYFRVYEHAASCQIVKRAISFLKDMDIKEKMFDDVLLERQEFNYVHSKMVEKISLLILDKMYDNRLDIVRQMISNIFHDYNDLRGFVGRAARLHDVGKSLMSGIINQQIRKLASEEYDQILHHPTAYNKLASEDKDLVYYKDIINGHHKNYDGKGGYPLDFDNTKSKYRLIIDLIKIADSIDAGTDVYGRCYREAKTLDTVLEELKNSAGTIYNPDIVKFIVNDEVLIKEIANLLYEVRMIERYKIYTQGV